MPVIYADEARFGPSDSLARGLWVRVARGEQTQSQPLAVGPVSGLETVLRAFPAHDELNSA